MEHLTKEALETRARSYIDGANTCGMSQSAVEAGFRAKAALCSEIARHPDLAKYEQQAAMILELRAALQGIVAYETESEKELVGKYGVPVTTLPWMARARRALESTESAANPP